MKNVFPDEYRRHPFWAAILVVALVVGLVLDFEFVKGSPPSSPTTGVPTPGGTE